MHLLRLLSVVLLLVVSASSPAATDNALTDPALALRVDDRTYTTRVAEIMHGAARQNRKGATWAQTLDGLIENQLVAADAVRDMGRDALLVADRVGFTPAVQLEDQLQGIVKLHHFRRIDADVRALPGGSLDKLVTWRIGTDSADLRELMTLRDRGEVRLTTAQQDLAARTPVARVALPDGETTTITFDDIYARMNVQARVQVIQDGDRAMLDDLVNRRVEALYIDWWARKRSGLSAAELDVLRASLEDRMLRENYLLATGVVSAIHEDTPPRLKALEQAVTREEIHDWYTRHKEDFRQVEKVRASHIRCASEADCEAAAAELKAGKPFAEVAARRSIADTRKATPAGSLGWVHRQEKNLPWLHQVALIQKAGQTTPPIRSPEDAAGKAVWEIVQVDERIEGYSDPDSETVAYVARQAIARRKAIDNYRARYAQLRGQAAIHFNGALLQARREAADATGGDRNPLDADLPDPHDHGHGGHRH